MPVDRVRGGITLHLSEFVAEHADLDREAFVSRFDHPFLLVEQVGSDEGGDDAGEGSGKRAFHTMMSFDPQEILEGGGEQPEVDAEVHPVRKEGNPQAFMVTVGRTSNNDIVLEDPSISKLHAYFKKDAVSGGYTLTDAGSTNGTTVGGTKLSGNESVTLEGGDTVQFGSRFKGTYHTPDTLHRYLDVLGRSG